MKIEMTPEEHARLHRRRGRQALGLVIAVLVLIGTLTVLHAGVNAVAKLFDDTAQKQEYEDKLEGLVLFDPVPFEGIENIDDLTLREAAVWGCVYSIQETQGGFDGYNTDPDTEQLLIPSVDVDAYLAKLVGPSFRMTHKTFEMEDMTVEFDDISQRRIVSFTSFSINHRWPKDNYFEIIIRQFSYSHIRLQLAVPIKIRRIRNRLFVYDLFNPKGRGFSIDNHRGHK